LNRTSLLYWLPKVEKLGIPIPRTEIVEIPYQVFCDWLFVVGASIDFFVPAIRGATRRIGFPLFMRSDVTSAKHNWDRTCYVSCEDELFQHIFNLLEFHQLVSVMGLRFDALVFREFLELDSGFRAFKGMPVSRERRYFIRDGKVQCHHPYWVEDPIAEGYHPQGLPEDWRRILKDLNRETREEVQLLTSYSEQIAGVLDGYWSVDYACTRKGVWYLIDMGEGEKSWHLKCKFKLTKIKWGA